MGRDPARIYLSCYDIAHEYADQCITMFVGTPVSDEVTEARAPAEIVVLPGVEVASRIRQGTAREVWPRIVHDVMSWIEDHGYEHVGPGRDFYLEINDAEPANQVFELQAPLRRPADPIPVVAPQRRRADHAAA